MNERRCISLSITRTDDEVVRSVDSCRCLSVGEDPEDEGIGGVDVHRLWPSSDRQLQTILDQWNGQRLHGYDAPCTRTFHADVYNHRVETNDERVESKEQL